MLAMIQHLGAGPAFIIGTSKATGGALRASLQAPDLVKGLALISPFIADPFSSWLTRIMASVLLVPPWGIAVFCSYFPRMYPTKQSADFTEHLSEVRMMLKEPGRLRALRLLFSESSGATYSRHSQIPAPVLILMGSRDPDFPHPDQTARQLAARLPHATVQMIEGAGHHAQAEMPEEVAQSILPFFASIEQKNAPTR
jgi:pimeloyl-ACP methyl ester carboxylesterase